MSKLYAVKNIDEGTYLNYASKKKNIFSKRISHYVVESPFPTLRPRSHIKENFVKWIMCTPYPEDYKIVQFTEKDTKLDLVEEEQ